MVLKALGFAAVLALACGCRQSLFDAHGETKDAAHGDAPAGATCPAPCLGDSGGDFDGTANGKTGRWRYLDDHRDRTWAPMTAMDNGFVGADPANAIKPCAGSSDSEACQALPGALLISTAGFTTPADPAIEFTADANKTIELQLSVYIPTGGFGQTVRIYRNSREDVLFTGTAHAAATLTQKISLDALEGDRFLVAIAPPALGQPDIGVQLFVAGANATFPTECQLAVPFWGLSGLTTDNVCNGSKLTAMHDSTAGAAAPVLGAAPYPELGQAANIAQHNFYSAAAILDRPGDVTVDLWLKHTMLVATDDRAWVYSETNNASDAGGGINVYVYSNQGKLKLVGETIKTGLGMVIPIPAEADYPADQKWHFVRVVHKVDGAIKLCLDGIYKDMVTAAGTLKAFTPPYIGQDAYYPTDPAAFIGSVDDIRVLNTALPCD